jgi:hypothetical protein
MDIPDDQAPLSPLGVTVMFLMLFGELVLVAGLLIGVFDHKLWALIPIVYGACLTGWCFHADCSPASYKNTTK